MKSQLVERTGSLKLVESKKVKDGCLGRLEGPCADFKNSTRNGRLYGLQLWKNVFNNQFVKEALATKTLFGELDHPEDRFEVLSKNACICMTDYDIREDEGLVYGGFDILDTPQGRILKSLVDYGSQMGVSSRGEGDIIQGENGEEVDPDTYDFACFDVVSTPAVKIARQTVVENVEQSKRKRKLIESIEKEINNTNNVELLDNIERTVTNCEIPNLNRIKRSIKDRKSKIIEGKTISSSTKKTKSKNSQINSRAKTIRESVNYDELISKLKAYKLREKQLKRTINLYQEKLDNLTEQLSQNNKIISRSNNYRLYAENANQKLRKVMNEHSNDLALYEDTKRRLDKTKFENSKIKRQHLSEIKNLEQINEKLQNSISALKLRNEDLESKLCESESIIESYKIKQQQLKDSLKEQISNSKVQEKANCEQEDTIQIQNDNLTRLEESYDILNSNYTNLDNQYTDLENRYNALIEKYNKMSNDKDVIAEKLNKSLKLNKQYTNDFLSTYSQFCGVDTKNVVLNESIATPNKIKNLVSEVKDRQDRYSILPISLDNKGPTTVNILNENIQSNKLDDEDLALEKFLTDAQNQF